MPRPHDPSRMGRAVLWTIIGLLASALAWSCIGELEVVSTVRGRVVPEAQLQIVQSAIAGTVRTIQVREGETVRSGQVLVELDSLLLQADVDATLDKLASLRAELVRIEAERNGMALQRTAGDPLMQQQIAVFLARQAAHEQKVQEYRAVLESRKAALKGGESLVKVLDRRLAIAEEKEQRTRNYVDIVIPRFQFLQWKDDVAAVEKELEGQRLTNQRLTREIEEASLRLMQVSSQRKQDIEAEFAVKQSALRQIEIELAKAEARLDDTVIRAPLDGTVQRVVPATIGASLNARDAVVQIVPSNSPLHLEVLIPNEEMGYMRTGQPVDIKLDAFPFQKYGRMTGTLAWISPDAELVTTSRSPLLTQAATLRSAATDAPRFYYKGSVQFDRSPNNLLQAAPGLTALADIRTDRRRIIDFLLFPMQQWLEEAVHVR